MLLATHIIRFITVEDSNEYLPQPVETNHDIGLDIFNDLDVEAHVITGDIYHPEFSDDNRVVRGLLTPILLRDVNYIRCMGLDIFVWA